MAVRAARTRTESMAQRLAKKPISEGFELWDKGYILGAMRLFIFKAENSPPFVLGPCLDAVAHLLLQIEELDDAFENFGFAAEKYELIQQPILVDLMRAKAQEVQEGPAAALQSVTELITKHDPTRRAHDNKDPKTRTGLARLYFARSELVYKLELSGAAVDEAIADAAYSLQVGWDRQHLSQYLIAKHLESKGDVAAAAAQYERTIEMNPLYLAAYEAVVPLLKSTDADLALQYLERAIAIHPRSSLIREKTFLMSERGQDGAALAYLDALIANPPLEEADPLQSASSTACMLYKAKAAILADAGRMDEALGAAEAARSACPTDEEAIQIVNDIRGTQ